MARYRKVDVCLWNDAKFRTLSDDAKLLWLHLLTSPMTMAIPGVIVSGPAGIAEVMGTVPERLAEPFQELFQSGLAKADFSARLVWLPNGPKRNPPANPNAVKSWAKAWDEVPDSPLKHEVWRTVKPFAERFDKQLDEPLEELFPEPLRERLPQQDQDQEEDYETEKEGDRSAAEAPSLSQPALALTPPAPPSPQEPPALPGEDTLAKAKRQILAKHRDPCLRIWQRFGELRVDLGTRKLKATAERLVAVAERLEAGATEAECIEVLEVYAAEARKSGSTEWFNGETPWRPKNFTRQLGRADAVLSNASGNGGPRSSSDRLDDWGHSSARGAR